MRLITPAICFFMLITTTLFSQTDKPELWQKAVAIQAANMDWTPGVMTMTFELLDKHGQPDMTDITSYKITLDDSGETKTEIVKALHNGKDVTEKRKEEMAKEEAKRKKQNKGEKEENDNSVGFSIKESPFHQDNQKIISVKPTKQDSTIDGKQCTLFRYSLPLKESTKQGSVWIDKATGAPVLHDYTTSPLPPRVKKMKNIVRYQYGEDDKFVVSQSQFKGVGGLLVIKKSFRGTMTFKDYWRDTK